MSEAKERVRLELNELADRTSKLTSFILSEKFCTLTRDMQYLMQDQLRTMVEYGNILRRRLDIWDKTPEELEEFHKIM